MKKIKRRKLRNIILTGKSGSGKGVRMDILADELNLKKISMGDVFREMLSKNTPLTKKLKSYMESGKFVPDELVHEIFAAYFKKHDYKGCILDGFPRTLKQARFLMDLLEKNGSGIDMIVHVHREDKDIIEHLIHRHTCKKCARIYHIQDNPPKKSGVCNDCGGIVAQRVDDSEEKIKMRLSEFKNKVEPMIDYLKKHDIHFAIVPGKVDPYSKAAIKKTVIDAIKDKVEL